MIKLTKLGIPDSLLIALIFAAGLVDSTIMVALAVYVLLCESYSRVKEAAKKALMLFGLFAVLQGGLHILDYAIRILLSDESGYNSAYSNLSYLLAGAKLVCFLVFAVKESLAYMNMRGTGVCVPTEPEPAPVAAAPVNEQPKVCSSCGNPIEKGVHFCKKCGAKTEQ